jgi:hypothetical protein
MKNSNQERGLKQQKAYFNKNSNIEGLQKSLSGSSIEKSPNFFMTGISHKYIMTIYDNMAVSSCISGPVFGDTVYGVQK